MDFNKIEKAAKVYEKVKALDAEIIAMEKFAMRVASGSEKITIDLRAEIPKEEAEQKVSFDEDGSIVHGSSSVCTDSFRYSLLGIMEDFSHRYGKKQTSADDKISQEISDTAALQILAILLLDKTEKRDKYLRQIQNIVE